MGTKDNWSVGCQPLFFYLHPLIPFQEYPKLRSDVYHCPMPHVKYLSRRWFYTELQGRACICLNHLAQHPAQSQSEMMLGKKIVSPECYVLWMWNPELLQPCWHHEERQRKNEAYQLKADKSGQWVHMIGSTFGQVQTASRLKNLTHHWRDTY
jgi:hypothetical protein